MFLKHFTPDRRRRKRQLFNSSVRVFSAKGAIEALGVNISEVGMSLFTIAHLPLESQIEIELIPPGSAEPVRMTGMVRHRALYLYGIEFVGDSDQQPVSAVTVSAQSACHPEQAG